jgi:hypothetical protein
LKKRSSEVVSQTVSFDFAHGNSAESCIRNITAPWEHGDNWGGAASSGWVTGTQAGHRPGRSALFRFREAAA